MLIINEALKIKPDCDDAYLDLGLIYMRARKFEETMEAFKKAVEINQKITSVIRQLPKLGIVEIPEGFFDFSSFCIFVVRVRERFIKY